MFRDGFLRFCFGVVIFCLFLTSSYAESDKAVEDALMKWNFALYDMPKPYGVALPNTKWRFVEAKDEMSALMNPVFLASGITNEKGEVILSKKERLKLFAVWQKSHESIWFVYSSMSFQLVVGDGKNNKITLDLIRPEPEYAKKQRLAEEEAAKNRKIPLAHSIYTQQGFDAKKFEDEYADWKKRFQKDLNSAQKLFLANMHSSNKIVQDVDVKELEKIFANSIHSGKKGTSFKKMIFDGYTTYRPATDGVVVLPYAVMFEKLALPDATKPIGFGGVFRDDEGCDVELWYMTFDDMSSWSVQDFKESVIFSTFKSPKLPAYNTLERNTWPTFVFIRDDKGRIMLYAMSKELSSILGHIYNRSLF